MNPKLFYKEIIDHLNDSNLLYNELMNKDTARDEPLKSWWDLVNKTYEVQALIFLGDTLDNRCLNNFLI